LNFVCPFINLKNLGIAKQLSTILPRMIPAAPKIWTASVAVRMAKSVATILALAAVLTFLADDSLARQYPAGAVDVLAPGDAELSVAGSGSGQVEGSGTDYVAFVAGLVTLVRSTSPAVSAADATHHIEATADRNPGVAAADAQYGWGVIDPVAAVLAVPGQAASGQAAPGHSGGGLDSRIVLPIVLAVLLALWFARSRVRRTRIDGAEANVE
jgi:hypothetical protein